MDLENLLIGSLSFGVSLIYFIYKFTNDESGKRQDYLLLSSDIKIAFGFLLFLVMGFLILIEEFSKIW
jgi:hypothetical protein